MSTRTAHLSLIKPDASENVSRAVINQNYDDIDTAVYSRVLISDIVNNLTNTATNKPLSAAQGKVLNDKIATTTFNVTVSEVVGSSSTLTCKRSGNVVTITGIFTIPTAPETLGYVTLFTVPSGYRPSTYVYAPLSSATETGIAFVPPMVRLGTNGLIQSYLRSNHAFGSNNWYFNMSYCIG